MLTITNVCGQKMPKNAKKCQKMPKNANVICESPLTTGNKAAVKLNKEVV